MLFFGVDDDSGSPNLVSSLHELNSPSLQIQFPASIQVANKDSERKSFWGDGGGGGEKK